jgi:hypothetical protein
VEKQKAKGPVTKKGKGKIQDRANSAWVEGD